MTKAISTSVRYAPWLLIIGIPFGAGTQNAILALAIAGLLVHHYRSRQPLVVRGHLVTAGCGILWLGLVTWLNPDYHSGHMLAHLFGYLPWIVLPCLCGTPDIRLTRHMRHALVVIVAFIAIVSVTQYLWGWQRVGLSIISGEERARGTWTHPLTLAYAGLLAAPFATNWLIGHYRHWCPWLFWWSTFMIVWTSRSRVVLVVFAGITILQILWTARSHSKGMALAAFIIVLAAAGWIDRDLPQHFKRTLAGQVDRHTDRYPDDRVAFWHAHLNLFLQRPIIGHGHHMPQATIERAYDAIGLRDFEKKYSAHNQYLQFLAEGGIVALLWYIGWWTYWFCRCKQKWPAPWATATTFSLLAFALATLTQNAFQDNEVRYVLTLILCQFVHLATNQVQDTA